MRWLKTIVVCALAALFAASGIRKATDPDAGSWQIVHGIARVAFGVFVIGGAVWQAVRRQQAEPTPPVTAESGPVADGERNQV